MAEQELITVENAKDFKEHQRAKQAIAEGKEVFREKPVVETSPATGAQTEAESEPAEPKTQEHKPKPKNAEERARQLMAEGKHEDAFKVLSKAAAKKYEKDIADRDQELQTLRTRKPEPEKPEILIDPPARGMAPEPKADDPKPTLKDFTATSETYEDANEKYVDALTDWKGRQAQKKSEKDAAEQTQRERRQTVMDRVAQAKSNHPNFESEGATVQVLPPGELADFVTGDGFKEPMEILQYLAENPAKLKEIQSMPLARRYGELILIERELDGAPEPKKQPVSRVAPPPKTVSGTSPPPPADLNGAKTMAEFRRLKQQGSR